MAAFWHFLHLLVWLVGVSFLWKTESIQPSFGIRLESPELRTDLSGEGWKVSAESGYLNPMALDGIILEKEVFLEWQGQIWKAEQLQWHFGSGRLSLVKPQLDEKLGVKVSCVELIPQNKGYRVEGLRTRLGIPTKGYVQHPMVADRLTLPIESLDKILSLGEELRRPLSPDGMPPEGKMDVGTDLDPSQASASAPVLEPVLEPAQASAPATALAPAPWDLSVSELNLIQSRFFARASFAGLELAKGGNLLRAETAQAKWKPLRWLLKKGSWSTELGSVPFESSVLFLEEGRLVLDQGEVILP